MKIGQIARSAGVGVETVRYYERQGLIAEPPRRASGYRRYPPETVDRIRFIRRAKELGFKLAEIGELLELRVDPDCTCSTIRRRAEVKIGDVEDRIRALRAMRRALLHITQQCEGDGPVSECPILDFIERDGPFGSNVPTTQAAATNPSKRAG